MSSIYIRDRDAGSAIRDPEMSIGTPRFQLLLDESMFDEFERLTGP
jgi:hypothetical protein